MPKWGLCPPLTYLCWATHTLIDFGAGMLGGVVRCSKRAAAATAADKKSPNWVSKFIALSNYSEQFISHVPSQCNIIAPVMSTMVSIQIFLVTVLYCTIVHKCCAGAVDPHFFLWIRIQQFFSMIIRIHKPGCYRYGLDSVLVRINNTGTGNYYFVRLTARYRY